MRQKYLSLFGGGRGSFWEFVAFKISDAWTMNYIPFDSVLNFKKSFDELVPNFEFLKLCTK